MKVACNVLDSPVAFVVICIRVCVIIYEFNLFDALMKRIKYLNLDMRMMLSILKYHFIGSVGDGIGSVSDVVMGNLDWFPLK